MKKILIISILIVLTFSKTVFASESKFQIFEEKISTLNQNDKKELFKSYLNKSGSNKKKLYPYLGYMYYNGIGVEKNTEMGVSIYERAVEEESPLGYYLLGKHYVENNIDFKKGISLLLKAIDKNSIEATLYIANVYENGIGVDKDAYYSLEYYHRASQMGSGEAKFIISQKLISSGDPSNYKKGVGYLIDAANLGNENACDTLQKLYIIPNKILENNPKSHVKYLICSADNGNVEAIKKVADYYSRGYIVMIDNKKAMQYYNKYLTVVKKPKTKEEYETYYKAGIAFIKMERYGQAVEILKTSSTGDVAEASKALARIYEGEYLGKPDYEKSLNYYTKAKKQGIDTTEDILRIQKYIKK